MMQVSKENMYIDMIYNQKCITKTEEMWYAEQWKEILNICLILNTIACKINNIARNLIRNQLKSIITFAVYNYITINESTDIQNSVQLVVFFCECDMNLKISEQLLEIVSYVQYNQSSWYFHFTHKIFEWMHYH